MNMFKKLIAPFYHLGDAGAAAIEFAFIAPVLIVIVLGVADYGKFMNMYSLLFGSTRAGAEYLLANWNSNQTTTAAGTEQQVCSFIGTTLSAGSCSAVIPNILSGANGKCTCATSGASKTCPGPTDPNPCGTDRLLYSVGVKASYNFTPTFIVSNFLGYTFNFTSAQCSGSVGNTSGGTVCPITWVRVQ
jgi:Flp pilus assembly protein TadG